MKVKANRCFHDVEAGILRRENDEFEVIEERAVFLASKGLVEVPSELVEDTTEIKNNKDIKEEK